MINRTLIVGALAAGLVIATTGPAHAGQPAERACLGEFFSTSASTFGHGFAHNVQLFAQNADQFGLRNLGEGIQILQAGESAVYPQVCQTD
jgi:hypothetical protein